MKRRIALVLVAALLMPALLQIAIGTQEDGWSNPFSDVSADDPNFDGIRDAVQQGLMAGTSAKTFSPETAFTLRMACALLAHIVGIDTAQGDLWYENSDAWALSRQLTESVEEDCEISAERLLTMMWRMHGMPTAANTQENRAGLSEVSSWAQCAVDWAIEVGLVPADSTAADLGEVLNRRDAAAMAVAFAALPEGAFYDPEQTLNLTIPPLVDGLELPISGATGYATLELPIWRDKPTLSGTGGGSILTTARPGSAFQILQEDGSWWQVLYEQNGQSWTGWIENRCCMLNLPDVIPSILYNDTNGSSSLFRSSGKEIPRITGEKLYDSLCYNERLGRDEYVMPILYSAVRDICAAQHEALSEGNCLVIYQTFRPLDTQKAVSDALRMLSSRDPDVRTGIETPPWELSWFIATDAANHQKGFALDVSMVKISNAEISTIGGYDYVETKQYENYLMPTEMHELSRAAASTEAPESTVMSGTMNVPAQVLQSYFLHTGFSLLESEWWHFNHIVAKEIAQQRPSDGNYRLEEPVSVLPTEISAQVTQ